MRPRLRLVLVLLLLAAGAARVHAQAPAPEAQVRAAVTAAPEELRAGAGVLGYDAEGALVTLREPSNELLCLADDPSDDRFEVACYHRALEPFMARGRALRAEGKSREEVMSMREQEARSGALPMPEGPAALYVRSGDLAALDPATGEAEGSRLRYVVYVPYATPASTGLSPNPGPGKPWLMDAGKPWAHIMLIPPQ